MTEPDPLTVYVSIGNSDDKLTQARWSAFHKYVNAAVRTVACHVYGNWLSEPSTPWQNSCIAFAITPDRVPQLKARLRALAGEFGQDSIAWAQATMAFIEPEEYINPVTTDGAGVFTDAMLRDRLEEAWRLGTTRP